MQFNAQELLSFGRSHTGRALGLFAVLGIVPGISWHDAAIAAFAIATYSFWNRCEASAGEGRTAADVAASAIQSQADAVQSQALPLVKAAVETASEAAPVKEVLALVAGATPESDRPAEGEQDSNVSGGDALKSSTGQQSKGSATRSIA